MVPGFVFIWALAWPAGWAIQPESAFAALAHPQCLRCVIVRDQDGTVALLPNDRLTPGAVDPTQTRAQACRPERQRRANENARRVPPAMRRAVFAAYGIAAPPAQWGRAYELDHRVPVKLEGLSAPENLWPQPRLAHGGAGDKDALENTIIRAVCRARSMTLADGQRVFLGDWRAAYLRYVRGR